MDIHIFVTDNEDGQEWDHNDWFYKTMKQTKNGFVRFGKLFKSRSAASRFANKIGTVVHWYPI